MDQEQLPPIGQYNPTKEDLKYFPNIPSDFTFSKNKYEGEIDLVTRKRHGQGTFLYDNPFFQYQGQWDQGIKNGKGKLLMRDNGYYIGDFVMGEMSGEGIMHWPDGSEYKGDFHEGEKHGRGVYTSAKGDNYNGQWHLNLMHGEGTYQKHTGETIVGSFVQNKPEGQCNITSTEGWTFEGAMVRGLKCGEGIYNNEKTQERYEGRFLDDLYHGEGLYQNESTGIVYEGVYEKGQMTLVPNFVVLYKEPQEKQEDETQLAQKGKQKRGKGQQDEQEYALQYAGETPISFKCEIIYQGPDFEDPDGWNEEELKEFKEQYNKEVKKRKKGDPEPQPFEEFVPQKFKTPDPIIVEQESGRSFKIDLIRKEEESKEIKYFKIDYRKELEQARVKREEIIKMREEQAKIKELELQDPEYKRKMRKQRRQRKKKKEVESVRAKVQIDVETMLDLYVDDDNLLDQLKQQKIDEAKEKGEEIDEASIVVTLPEVNKSLEVVSHQGYLYVENLEFPNNFPSGNYLFQVQDITTGIDSLPTIEIPIEIEGKLDEDQKGKKKKR